MTHVFKHPKFYRIPRDKKDQAISWRTHDGGVQRAPDPGLKLQAASHKHQASSFKRQAFEPTSSFKRQATSIPARVTSVKHQATSSKLPDPRTMVHGYWRSIRGTRTEGLYHDKSIVGMACVEGNLVWTKSNFFTFRYLEFYSTKVPRSIIDQ